MTRITIATLSTARTLTADEMRRTIGGSSIEAPNHDLNESHTGDSRKKKKKKHGKKGIRTLDT
jgi:hypothetical protein